MDFEKYFTEAKIVRILCKYRAIQASKRHDLHMIRNFSVHPRNNKILSTQKVDQFLEIAELFPTRRNWKKIHRNKRKLYSNSLKTNEVRLYNSYEAAKKAVELKGEIPPIWYEKLIKFATEIQKDILDIESLNYVINSPVIKGIKKSEKEGKITYRPIAVYDTKSKIICSLTAKYFTDFFDEHFLSCSYAFRAKNSSNQIPSHHDCIQKIAAKRKNSKILWAAECDIQKFFDIVNHRHLLQVFYKLTKKIEIEHGNTIDSRSVTLFQLFLNSYSFQKNVLQLNGDAAWFEKNKLPVGKFGWVDTELRETFGDSYCNDNLIGVPQGNAISCFVANLILHDVDETVLTAVKDIFYIRYCDDMILLHSDKTECEKALKVFMGSLENNFLLYHTPTKNLIYKEESKTFWNDSKSKLPYFWADKNTTSTSVPWLAFVGYQINFDGRIRVRKKTLIKETKKQVLETQKIIINLGKLKHFQNVGDHHSRWSKRQIIFSLQQRLISMSVGRIKIYNHTNPLKQGLCWTNGFKKLKNNNIVSKQLRYLDRKRGQQLNRLRISLSKIKRKSDKTTFKEDRVFYGAAFSYFNFLKHK